MKMILRPSPKNGKVIYLLDIKIIHVTLILMLQSRQLICDEVAIGYFELSSFLSKIKKCDHESKVSVFEPMNYLKILN